MSSSQVSRGSLALVGDLENGTECGNAGSVGTLGVIFSCGWGRIAALHQEMRIGVGVNPVPVNAKASSGVLRIGTAVDAGKKWSSKQIHLRRQRHRKFQISDLRFQMEKTANANANTNANADPSALKAVRDDSRRAIFRDLKGRLENARLMAGLKLKPNPNARRIHAMSLDHSESTTEVRGAGRILDWHTET
jgi:hypothetical protein